jgi:hypothetical protein
MSAFRRQGGLLRGASLVLADQTSDCTFRQTGRLAATPTVHGSGGALRDRRTCSVFKHGQRPSTHC